MVVKKNKDLGVTWKCECGKWNFGEATHCWKCHEPKVALEPKKRIGRPEKELVNAS